MPTPTNNFRGSGASRGITPGAALTAGDMVKDGQLVGFPANDVEAGQLAAVINFGDAEVPKATGVGTAIPVGTETWYDTVAKQAVRVPGSNRYSIGPALATAGENDESVRVLLWPRGPVVATIVETYANPAAGADTADLRPPALPVASRLVAASLVCDGNVAGVDNANTVVIAIKNAAGAAISTTTFNAANAPGNNSQVALAACDPTNGTLAANERLRVDCTQGPTADLPAYRIVFFFVVDR